MKQGRRGRNQEQGLVEPVAVLGTQGTVLPGNLRRQHKTIVPITESGSWGRGTEVTGTRADHPPLATVFHALPSPLYPVPGRNESHELG